MWSDQNLGYKSNGLLPNIKGTFGYAGGGSSRGWGSSSGAFTDGKISGVNALQGMTMSQSDDLTYNFFFDASLSSSVYQDDVNHVIPACTIVYYMIHY